jgi:hypothetical protein
MGNYGGAARSEARTRAARAGRGPGLDQLASFVSGQGK